MVARDPGLNGHTEARRPGRDQSGRGARARLIAVGLVVVAGYAWIAAALRPFTTPEEVAVAIPIAIASVLALRGRGAPPDGSSAPRRGAPVWAALLVAITAWELLAYVSSPRHDHPTLSSITDSIMSVHVGRALVFVLWLGLGAIVAAGLPARRRS